jgi:hypothetical protein
LAQHSNVDIKIAGCQNVDKMTENVYTTSPDSPPQGLFDSQHKLGFFSLGQVRFGLVRVG